MDQKSLSRWLKFIIVGVGLCGLFFYLVILPSIGWGIVAVEGPECAYMYWPWQIFLWATGVPCCVALVLAWRIAGNIGKDRSFSMENARLLKYISLLAVGDTAFFFVTNIVFLFLNMSHPGVLLFSLVVDFAGVAVAVAAAALSHLVQKAAALQEQTDLTI